MVFQFNIKRGKKNKVKIETNNFNNHLYNKHSLT